MNIDKKKLIIQILALIGLCLSIKLAFIYHDANYNKYALSSFCSINDFIDCDGAAKTNTAQFLGLPLAWWGIFFYLIVLFMTVVDKIKEIEFLKFLNVFKNSNAYISFLGTIAFIVSMLLACISLFYIHKLCILCVLTYFIDLIIALIASELKFMNVISSFKTTFFDFLAGVKTFPRTFVVLLIVMVSFLSYSAITLKFVPHIKKRNEIMKYAKIKFNPYRVKGNLLGAKDADVVVELYSDYVCPHCYINNIMLHKALKEFKNVKVVHHNLPFDKECNHYISINMHPKACFMSKVAIAARNQNNYWEMSSLLYENQPQNYDEVLKLVDKLGFDKAKFEQDFNSNLTAEEVQKEIQEAEKLEIDATPTMFINGKKYVGIKPYYNLREILIEHGAKRK